MLLTKFVKIKTNPSNMKKLKEKGYNIDKSNQEIEIKIEDLGKHSRIMVEIKCDYCGKVFERMYMSYCNSASKIDACSDCISKKIKDVFIEKYNVENISQLEETQQKIRKNNLEKYGIESTSCLESTKEKYKMTNLKRYGKESYTQTDEYKEKVEKTNIEKYGVKYAISAPQTREKIISTFKNKYGIINPSQDNIIMSKIISSKYIEGTQTSSKQQRFIRDCLNGELNYPFKRFYIDVAILKDKIAIEYIGGGHNLSVKLGYCTQQEFNRNENFRRKQLFEGGWKLIEFISLNNKILDKQKVISIYNFCFNPIQNGKHYIIVNIDKDIITNKDGTITYKNTLND